MFDLLTQSPLLRGHVNVRSIFLNIDSALALMEGLPIDFERLVYRQRPDFSPKTSLMVLPG
jgi:hypothetical protein